MAASRWAGKRRAIHPGRNLGPAAPAPRGGSGPRGGDGPARGIDRLDATRRRRGGAARDAGRDPRHVHSAMAAALDPDPGRAGGRLGSRRSRRAAHRRDHRVVRVRTQRRRASSCSPWGSSRRSSGPGGRRGPGTGRCSSSGWPASSPTASDPEGWQTGAVGFWEHLLSPEVVQHRILLILTALFGFAEWRVRSGRHPDSPWRYVFPIVAIWSGVLLVAHAHEVSDGKSAFFMELSHLGARPREPAGGLVTLARAPAASCRERRARPDLGPRAGRLRVAARPLSGGVTWEAERPTST